MVAALPRSFCSNRVAVESSSTSKTQNLNADTAARSGALTGCSRELGRLAVTFVTS
jgi:hypothetical protein